ncbi:uncharacterized protein RHO25_010887 [Cercospora beticola]|uniref:Uncharacterized protein n=1 Tax=Cercospora beticola TaxID=122368 RepID=A0ABZ0P338_CERBT|nr:hypothetical protein RHO25_010887 [Cercospora beticola]
MKRRTKTENVDLTLPASDVANFSFLQLEAVTISVPDGSSPRMQTRWRFQKIDARSVRCISGRLVVSTCHRESRWNLASIDESGSKEASTISQHTSPVSAVISTHDTGHDRVVIKSPITIVFVADMDHNRDFRDAALDDYICAHMCSPPYWLTVLLRFSCNTQRRLVLEVAHHIRSQMLLYAMGCHIYCGLIPFSLPWRFWSDTSHPPEWILELEARTMLWTSELVMMACYWVGSVLGIDSPHKKHVSERFREKTGEK